MPTVPSVRWKSCATWACSRRPSIRYRRPAVPVEKPEALGVTSCLESRGCLCDNCSTPPRQGDAVHGPGRHAFSHFLEPGRFAGPLGDIRGGGIRLIPLLVKRRTRHARPSRNAKYRLDELVDGVWWRSSWATRNRPRAVGGAWLQTFLGRTRPGHPRGQSRPTWLAPARSYPDASFLAWERCRRGRRRRSRSGPGTRSRRGSAEQGEHQGNEIRKVKDTSWQGHDWCADRFTAADRGAFTVPDQWPSCPARKPSRGARFCCGSSLVLPKLFLPAQSAAGPEIRGYQKTAGKSSALIQLSS